MKSPIAGAAAAWGRRSIVLAGPGALVAAGYIDPGNWATDLAGGSRFAYSLLSVVVACSLIAMLFQAMCARLGIATGRDLAVLTRELHPRAAGLLWLGAELAVVATDLAEVLGSALALKLLFGLPLLAGVALTVLDVALILGLERGANRVLERLVASLALLVGAGLCYELVLSHFDGRALLSGLVPRARIAQDPQMLFASVGILGATVMPHNLYLHSSLVQAHRGAARSAGDAARRVTVDTIVSLAGATLMNAALVVLAAAAFHGRGRSEVASIEDAHRLLAPLLGSTAAPVVFALSLLAAGQSATITGTLAGQVIMSGLLELRWPAWRRRLVTRACAMLPAFAVIARWGESSTGQLLLLSQVVLSLQLPFAIVPLMRLTSDPKLMGGLVNALWMRAAGWASVVLIVAANLALLYGSLVPPR